ncbi:hypothetical protein [Paenibacillus sp. FSL H3-0333]|uniref:hypothetical protein n=1 Tax=Paenibacillus sp. FSL H3-0333 TaxID=2921373 RepID=UPI0030F71450
MAYNYYNFKDAKVTIAHTLMAKGWEVFGYSPDQSDSMTDYFCPAHWAGIASKNGYVLLVDVSSLHDSGRRVTKRSFNGTTKDVQSKITKLQNMTTDKGASQQEEESAKAAIEKLLEKQNEGWTEEVVAVYPEFKNVNPSTSKWHIEKDGVLVDKGTGIGKFSELPHMWDGANNKWAKGSETWGNGTKKEISEETQKVINSFNKFISRIEKIVNTIAVTDGSEVGSADVETMQKVTEKVTKTVTRPVQVEKRNIEVGDYLTFTRHCGFWLVTDVYTVNGKTRINYENVGSGKRGYQQLKNCTRYYDLEERMLKAVEEGKTVIHQMSTFDEVTEVEKWVKVGKAPKTQKVDTKEEAATGETTESSNGVTMTINEELNGIELKFSKPLTEKGLSALYANGFKWSRRGGKWWAKNTPERLVFAETLVKPFGAISGEVDTQATQEAVAPETVTEVDTDNQNDNVIYYKFNHTEATAEPKKEDDTLNMNDTYIENNDNDKIDFDTLDDIFSKFDKVEITAYQKISSEDLEFCQEQESIYKKTIVAYNTLDEHLQAIVPEVLAHGKKFGSASGYSQRTSFDDGFSSHDLKYNLKKIKDKFISMTCEYFSEKYNVSIDEAKLQQKYDTRVTYENIVEEIILQLDGHSFTEKAASEIKEKARNTLYGDNKITIRNNKLILDGYYVRHDSIWKEYRLTEKKDFILNALSHFDNGSVKINIEFSDRYCGYENEKKASNYDRYETQSLDKIKSIKFLKNGKMEIEFASHTMAAKFAGEYCGYKKQAI